MNTRIALRYFVLLLVGVLSATAHAASNSELEIAKYFDSIRPRSDVEIMKVKAKDGRMVSVTVPVKDGDKLFKTSPSELRKARMRMRQSILAQCSSRGNPITAFAVDFAPESLKFYTAIGLSAGDQMKEDPAYAQHFIQNSFMDPMGYASFAGFMIGSRGAASLLAMTGVMYDECTLIKKFPKGLPNMRPTKFQRLFSPLAGQMTMVAGMMVSTTIDALRDPHIIQCAALTIGKVDEKDRATAEKSCDQAYEDWVMNGGKLRDMMPDFLSMTGVGLFLSSPQITTMLAQEGYLGAGAKNLATGVTMDFALNQTKSKILFRGATMVMKIGKGLGAFAQFPAVRWGLEIANMWAFFHFQDKVKPIVTTPWQTIWQNYDIEKTRTEVNNWIVNNNANGWNINLINQKARCYNDMGHGNVTVTRCPDANGKAAEAIALLGRQEKKWRDFLMADAMTGAQNWQNYVLNFSNLYTSSNKIYEDLLGRIDYQRNPKHDQNFFEKFYNKYPLNGTKLDFPNDWDGDLCTLTSVKSNATRFSQALAYLDSEIKDTHAYQTRGGAWHDKMSIFVEDHYDRATLLSLRDGIAALDCSQNKGLGIDQRVAKYEAATELLWKQLIEGPHQAWALTIDSPDYMKAAWNNTYMKVFYALGGPEPQHEGGTYVRQLNTNPDMVNQDYKDMKPTHVGMVRTTNFSDYILASMVCGPTADPSNKDKIAQANWDRLSWWERTKAIVSGKDPKASPYTEKDMIQVEKYYEKNVTAEPTWRNLGGILKNDMTIFNTVEMWKAEFRPPRVVRDMGFNPCGESPNDRKYISKYVAKFDGTREAYTMDPYFTEWKINGKTYKGLQALLREFARPDLTATSAFENWWDVNVQNHVQKVVNIYRTELIDLLNKKYVPVIANPKRSMINGRPFGLTNSIIDSANGYFNMLIPLVKIGPKGGAAEAEMKRLAQQYIMRLRVQLMLIGTTSQVRQGMQAIMDGKMPEQRGNKPAPAVPYLSGAGFPENALPTYIKRDEAYQNVFNAYQFNSNQLALLQQKMMSLAATQAAQLAAGPSENLKGVLRALFENLTGLVTEIDSYHGASVAVRSPMVETSAQK